jgi:hypothetical protein
MLHAPSRLHKAISRFDIDASSTRLQSASRAEKALTNLSEINPIGSIAAGLQELLSRLNQSRCILNEDS